MPLGALLYMTNHSDSPLPRQPLDVLTTELLEVGASLSQIVGGMIKFEAQHGPVPDAAPIPEVAHFLIRSVLDGVGKHHSKRDIRVAAAIIAESNEAISENIFIVDPKLFDEFESEQSEI